MYILQNQNGYFLTKSKEWTDGREPNLLFRTQHKDEAVNELFEVNSKDYTLRLKILSCEVTPKKVPVIPDELLPPPLFANEATPDENTQTEALDFQESTPIAC